MQLLRRLGKRPAAPKGSGEARVQLPCDPGRRPVAEPGEPAVVEGFGREREARLGLEVAERPEGGRLARGVAKRAQRVEGLEQHRACGCGVAVFPLRVADEQPRQCRPAAVGGALLRPQCELQGGLGPRIALAHQQDQPHPLLRSRSCRGVARPARKALGPRVVALRFGEPVELYGEVGPSQGEAGELRPRSPLSGAPAARESLGPLQLGPGSLQITHRRPCLREVAPHGDLIGHGACVSVDPRGLGERRDRRGIIAPAHGEQPEVVQHERRVHSVPALPVDRERLAIACGGRSVVALEARDVAEVDEVRRGGLGAVGPAVRGQRSLEGAARPRQVAQRLGDEAEVVLIGGQPAGVAGALSELRRPRVQLARASEVAAVLTHAPERSQGVPGGAVVPDALREVTRSREIRLCAVEFLGEVESGADVPRAAATPVLSAKTSKRRRLSRHAPSAASIPALPRASLPARRTLSAATFACRSPGDSERKRAT